MHIFSLVLVVVGLAFFETITSIDNAIINAQVLSTMKAWARRWFLVWGLLVAVFIVRGVLPWLMVWATVPSLGALGALTATFSGDAAVVAAIEKSAPVLLIGGGTFLVFLFCHWLFLEPKNYGLRGEALFQKLILLGNGLGAAVVRLLTVGNIGRIKKYVYLKNGAMYSILLLGLFMVLESFGMNVPVWVSPVTTFGIVGFFFLKSRKVLFRA